MSHLCGISAWLCFEVLRNLCIIRISSLAYSGFFLVKYQLFYSFSDNWLVIGLAQPVSINMRHNFKNSAILEKNINISRVLLGKIDQLIELFRDINSLFLSTLLFHEFPHDTESSLPVSETWKTCYAVFFSHTKNRQNTTSHKIWKFRNLWIFDIKLFFSCHSLKNHISHFLFQKHEKRATLYC